MSEVINCPECGYAIELDKAMAKKAAVGMEKEIARRVANAKQQAEAEADEEIGSLLRKLEEANKNELNLRKQKTELEQRAKDIDLEVQRKLDHEKELLEARVGDRIAESWRAKDAEKDKKLTDTLAQVEDLKRRMEQGSQQAQGETFEAELEDMLRTQFPLDVIDPVSPGVKGGDILQTVKTKTGVECGRILWEIKRTKTWLEAWIAKIKSDARNAKADVCLIATEALPKQVDMFGEHEGVWVSSPGSCLTLAYALRQGLLRAAREKYMQAGKKDKAVLVYEYFTGQEFRGRVEAIIESYRAMKSDLDSERRGMEKVWAKREKQILMVTSSLSGMHGEIEAIAAGEMPAIPALQLGGDK